MKNKSWMMTFVFFVLISIGSIGLRIWKIDQPIADWHSFRQVDTASVAQMYSVRGIDLLHPRYHDLSNIQSGKDNPEGWRMVEFPLYQGIAAFCYSLVSNISIELYLRLVTIISSTATGLFLGIMVMRRSSRFVGLMTSFIYAVLPFSIYYGRVVLPDPFMVFLSISALFILDSGDKEVSWVRLFLSSIVGAFAMLVKPQAAFLLLPVLPLLFKRPFKVRMGIQFLLWGIIVLVPFLWWRNWIAQYPEGIPAFDWLLNKNDIRFKGAWFYWLFADRIGRLILGYWGLIPFGIGLIYVYKREGLFFRLFVVGTLLYLSVIAGGNVQHDYYQILLIPMIAIYLAKGISNLWLVKEEYRSTFLSRGLAVLCVAFTLSFSWYFVRSYYWINHPEIIEAGKMADQLLPKNAKVIAAYNGDTTFLYQTKRSGWPLNFDIDKKIAMGATAYVTISPTDNDLETKELAEKYTVLVRNEKYAIIDLTRKK